MGNLFANLLSCYEEMLEATNKQLTLLDNPELEDVLLELQKLDQAKVQHIEKINQCGSIQDAMSFTADERLQLTAVISKIQMQSEGVKSKIDAWFKTASTSMKQVTTQRKTLNSYAGANSVDVISYYFDIKQ